MQASAEEGDAESQFALALAYEKGDLVDTDLAWAARWYGRAAYRGHEEGQFSYGRLKMEGLGVRQDLGAAYRWLSLAAMRGHTEAKDLSADLELRLGIDLLYEEQFRANNFEPATGPWLSDPPTVEYLQAKLGLLGFDPGPADGIMGPRTASALAAYQATQDLPPSSPLSEGLLEKIRGANTEDIQSSPQWDNPDQTSKADPSQ